jgi:tetratricopeptide (TPR) repeat protein
LPDPGRCRDPSRLSALDGQLEDDGETMIALDTLSAFGPDVAGDEAVNELQSLLDGARRDDVHGVLARAAGASGSLWLHRGRLERAGPLLDEAARAALEAGDAELAARAWIALAELARRQGQPGRARLWLDYADARVRALASPGVLEAELASARARVCSSASAHADALAFATTALEAWRESAGERRLEFADALDELARVHAAAGELEASRERAAQARTLRVGLLGAGHPALGPSDGVGDQLHQ